MSDKYILDETGNSPVPEPDLLKWSRWFEMSNMARKVGATSVGDSDVSTVFLGVDHGFGETLAPVLWETMVFGGPLNEVQDRCSGNREQAQAMHARMVERVKASAQGDGALTPVP